MPNGRARALPFFSSIQSFHSSRASAHQRSRFGRGVLPALMLFFLSATVWAQGSGTSILSHGDFEPDQATTVVEMPNPYVVGTHQTGIWHARLGTGSQQVSFQTDGAGNHFASVGTSPNQPGLFQVIAWPGEGTAQLTYAYSGPRAVVRIFGAEAGDTIAKFSSQNSLTLLQQIENPAAAGWTTVTHDVVLTGAYDHLVVRFGTAGTGASLYDDISLSAPVPPADTVPAILTESLPDTQVGAAYSATLQAEGGNGALSWSVIAGALPDGLALSTGGVVSGTATTAGTSNFTVRVVDGDANVALSDASDRDYSIAVNEPMPPTVSLVTTRTSGVAPLAVSFDASGTTSLTTSRPFHDLHYRWDYGDPGSGVWSTSRKSKNHDTGAIGGHVFETPGTYIVSVTVTDGAGATSQQSVEITVEDPDVVFSGTSTICISTDGDFTGAPAGSQQLTTSGWSDIANALGTGKRVLLKRGNIWVFNGVKRNLTFPGPGILGAFGSGPKPVITFNTPGTERLFWLGTGATPNVFGDFRFMDLEIQGRGFGWGFLHSEGSCHNVTVLRVDMHNAGMFLNLAPSILSYYNNDNRPGHTMWSGIAVVDNRYDHIVGDGTEFNGRHIAYIGAVRSMFMGNVWNGSELGEHVLRVPFAQRFLIAHNELTNTRSRKHLIKLHGGGLSDYNGQPVPAGENQTKFVTIADNYFTSDLGDWLISVGPQNDSSPEVARDLVIERNEVLFGGDTDIAFHVAASEVTVRNNTVVVPNAGGTAISFIRRGVEPLPTNNRAYNNSAFHGGAGGFTFVSVGSSAVNTTVRNNLGKTLGTGTPVGGTGTNLQASNNLITATPGWVANAPAAALQFDLAAGSVALGAGAAVPVFDDFELSPRVASSAVALGAFQSPPTTANAVPTIVTNALPSSPQGVDYFTVLEATGGNGRLRWSLDSGALPPGLQLFENGQINGTPAVAGVYSFSVRLADADAEIGAADEHLQSLSLTILPPPNAVPEVATTALPPGVLNAAYSRTLTASPGDGALTWTLDTGALPPGLSLSSAGVIAGTPTATGAYSFTVRVADSDGLTGPADEGTRALELVINPEGSITALSGSGFYNTPMATQSGAFIATFDVTPSLKPINGNVGLSANTVSAFNQLAAIVGFNATGNLSARNGDEYTFTPPAIPYEAGVTYRFRFVVDVPAHTYSVYVTPEGGGELLLADNFAFRTEQNAVTSLSNLSVNINEPASGWLTVTNLTVVDAATNPVTGVSVSPSELAIDVGESDTLTATIVPANADTTTVTWASSAPGVATVNNAGVVTGVSEGVATITATTADGGFTATSQVTVTGAPPNELEGAIFSDAATHAYGATGTLDTAIRRSGTASWRISYGSDFATSTFNPQGADVTMAGLTPYSGSGYFEFWYRSTKAGTIRFQVRDAGAGDAIVFNPDSAPITTAIVATEEWTRVEIPFNGWAVAPSSTANWRLQIRAWGAMTGAVVHYDDVRFVAPAGSGDIPALSVAVSPEDWLMEIGQTKQLTAMVGPPNATNQNVTWSSSNPSVASVNAGGVVSGVGVGSAIITATTEDGGHTAGAAIAVVATQANRHPFLFFTADDIPAIRERVNAPEVADRRARLFARANALLAASPSLDSRNMQGNSGLLAFAYVISGDVRYAERAIEEALATAALDSWVNGHDFNRGADLVSSERSLGAALVYDWCHDVMTPTQRATIRNALLDKGVSQYFSSVDPSLSPNWWVYDPVNNWRGVCHGGSGIGALVLYYESELARRATDLANQHLPLTLRALMLEDSGGHEGITYNNYGVEYALKGVMAMQRFYGGHEALLEELALDRLGNYWSVYLHGPDHHFANISRHNYVWAEGLYGTDGAVEGGPSSQRSALFESLTPGGDRLLRWAADNGGQRFYWNAASPFYFLWRRAAAPSTYQQPKPALQKAVLFRGAGHGVFQSDRLWMAYSGGATHNRGDGGAFVLVAKTGDTWERLIHLEPSLGFFGSAYQSTYLINGVGQRTGLDTVAQPAKYLRFGSGSGFHYAASDLRPLYANSALSKLNRHVVVVRGKYVVLLDDLAGAEALHYEARFQTASANTIALGEGAATILGTHHDLHVVSGGFDPFAVGQGEGGGVRYASFSRQAGEAALLTVLYPTGKAGAAPTVQVADGVVTLTHGSETDEIVFVRDAQDWRLGEVNGASADGIPMGEERNIVPYRDGRDDTSEVPAWLLATVGEPTTIPVTSVSLNTSGVVLNVGQNQTVTANVLPADASNRAVTWTSSDPSVATVSPTALNAASIRGVGVGIATITATTAQGGFAAQLTVTVNTLGELIVPHAAIAPMLDGSIDAAYGDIIGVINKPAAGETVPSAANLSSAWRAVFTPTDLHLLVDVTDDALITTEASDWNNDGVELFLDGNNSKTGTSDNVNDLKFVFLPQANGTVLIRTAVFPPNPSGLDYAGVQAAISLKEEDSAYRGYVLEVKVPLAILGITPQEGRELGIDFQINDNDTEGGRDRYVTWFGSNLNNNPAAYGTVTFGAIDADPSVPVTRVSVAPDEIALAIGATQQLTATIEPVDADNANVSWSSSHPAIAAVDENGLVTAVAAGGAVITVKTEDGNFTAATTVTVALPIGASLLDYALGVGEPDGRLLHRPTLAHANGRASLTFQRAQPGVTYVVEASGDLDTWTVLAINPGAVGAAVTVEDTPPSGATRRFLRLAVTLGGNTERSQPEGYVALELPAGSSTRYYSHPLLSPAIYRGEVAGVSANEITVVGAPFNAGAFTASPYWLRVLEGAQAGRQALVVANTGNSVTVDLQDGASQSVALTAPGWSVAAGDVIEIAPADTLDSLFGQIVTPGNSLFTADTVSLWDGTRWVAYYRSTTQNAWIGQFTGNAPQNDRVIAAQQAWGLTRRPARPAATLVLPGVVPESRQLLRHGGAGTVYTGIRFPVPQTLADFEFDGPGNWNSSDALFSADTVSLWDGTRWVAYWRTPAGKWRRQGDASNADHSSLVIAPGSAVSVLRRAAATAEDVFISQPQPYSDPRQ